MIGAFWNVRGLNKDGRQLMVSSFIKSNHLDFIGVVETKKNAFDRNYLKISFW